MSDLNLNPPSKFAQAITELLYETSLVTSGFSVDSPKAFADRIYSMIGMAANAVDSSDDSAKPASQAVEAEVLDDNSDPWKQ